MLNVIKSIIATMITLAMSLISFIRGPLVVGLVVALAIMSFAKKAEAGEVYAPYQCNHSACPFWDALSFSEAYGLVLILAGVVIAICLSIYDKNKAK